MRDQDLFGLGGSGTGRNVESPSEQERNISWVIIVGQLKPLQIAMTSWLGSVLQGTNKGGPVPGEPRRALTVSGFSDGDRTAGLEVTSGPFTWPNQTRRGNLQSQAACGRITQEATAKPEIKISHRRWIWFGNVAINPRNAVNVEESSA